MFNYRRALVRPLAKSFNDALKMSEPDSAIDIKLAETQHQSYTDLLKTLLPEVLTVPVDNQYPDCCFIEDTAEVIGEHFIINQLGAQSRQGEEIAVEAVARNLDLTIHKLTGDALADGGDILFTGDAVFIGMSRRTNSQAFEQISAIVSPIPVYAIELKTGLHLKSFLSQIDTDCLLVSNCQQGIHIAQQIEYLHNKDLRFVFVQDTVASNCLRIGGHIVMQAGFVKSNQVIQAFAEELHLQVHALNMSEFIKADGALTCCSILIP